MAAASCIVRVVLRSNSRLRPSPGAPCFTRLYSTASVKDAARVAVLYQELEPPIINGQKKPKKPGGYQDSGADIAFNLRNTRIDVITPQPKPDPAEQRGWTYPDTEEGILEALGKGATHLWANTILFASHPLQTSAKVGAFQDKVRVVGQGPLAVELYDDKNYVNNRLREAGSFTLPRAWNLPTAPTLSLEELKDISYPVVAKPVRGRGSYGVKVCRSPEELLAHVEGLRKESLSVMVEEFLAGEEATVTVMPPTKDKEDYWSLPVVTRFNHHDGIAPYNGVVAVTSNSRAVPDGERDPIFRELMEECNGVARFLGTTAPIRIDARRLKDSSDSRFAIFDVNMKPNMTGPGRPGRDDQASLTLLAAAALGWDYKDLLQQILATASTLRELRAIKPR